MSISQDQEAFIEWLMDPREASRTGGKGSQNDWCRDRGIKTNTAAGWKRQREFIDAWRDKADDQGVGPLQIIQVRDAMYAKALTGDTKAADVWVKLASRVNPVLFEDPKEPEKAVDGMTDEEIAAALKGA